MKTFDKKIYLKSFFITTLFCLCLSAGCTEYPKEDQHRETVAPTNSSKKTEEFDAAFVNYEQALTIAEKQIMVAIANDPSEYQQGLSDRTNLDEEQGMLFDFRGTEVTKPGFWMQRMQFDLDIIWIKNNRIIGITKNVPHPKSDNEKLPLYSPPGDIDMVLEVTSGFSEKNNLKIGDEVK